MTEIKIDGRVFKIEHHKSDYHNYVLLTIEDRRETFTQYFNTEDFKVLVDFLNSFSKNKIST